MHRPTIIFIDDATMSTTPHLVAMAQGTGDTAIIDIPKEPSTETPHYNDTMLYLAEDHPNEPLTYGNPERYCHGCGRRHKSFCVRRGRAKHFDMKRKRR